MATHSSTFTITLVIPLSILCTSFNGYLEHQVRSTSNCCEQCSEHSAPVVEVIKKGLRRTEHKQLCHTEMRFLHYLFLSTNENLQEANTKCQFTCHHTSQLLKMPLAHTCILAIHDQFIHMYNSTILTSGSENVCVGCIWCVPLHIHQVMV